LRHEYVLVALAAVLLALVMTWPSMKDPRHTLPGDTWDVALVSWQMAWAGHAIKHDPGQLWQGNAFQSEQYSFAFTDPLLGYLPASLIGDGFDAAILRYNLVFEFVFALTAFGAYMLARQLGSGIAGAAVAGAAFAYAPWRWTQVFHLHLLSTGAVALALAMLARGHGYSLRHGYRPERARPWWALGGWLVAAWQMTISFGVGIPFAYVLGILTLASIVYWWRKRPPFSGRLLRFDVIGVLVFLATSAAMAYPYFRVVAIYPYARRQPPEILTFSPAFRGYFTAPPTDWLWGDAQTHFRVALDNNGGWEALLLPGFVLYGLALVGLFVSVWSRRHRILLLLAVLGVGYLGMGLRAPVMALYLLLLKVLPGWDAIRTPGRLVVWVTLLLGLLAAGAITALIERIPDRAALVAVASALPVALILLEGVQTIDVPTVPRPPVAFSSLPGPVLVLPSNWMDDELTMLWSTDGFVKLENGSSGFLPVGTVSLRRATQTFPDQASVTYLRGRGVKTVLVLRHPYAARLKAPPDGAVVPAAALTAPVEPLGITREDLPDAVVYHL
jgi:hypothetical protein